VTATEVTVGILPESAFSEWNDLVGESADGSIYSTPEYLDALCRAGGGSFQILQVRHGDNLAGGLAIYRRESPFGAYVAPRLLLYYNGIVLKRYGTKYPSIQTARHLKTLAALGDHLSGAGYAWVNLRSRNTITDVRPFLDLGWSASPSYSYEVPVADLDPAYGRVEQNLRRLIARCEQHPIHVTRDDDFESFYHLHDSTRDRRGGIVYLPRTAFKLYFDTLYPQNLCRLFHARTPDGRAVATQLVLLGAHPVTHTVAAAADPEFMKLGVSAFLRWKVFEALSAMGYRANDLTDASLNSVTRFKSQLGGGLACNIVLDSGKRLTYRCGTAVFDLGWRARVRLGRLARRLAGRAAT
jgi:hypothetical protein